MSDGSRERDVEDQRRVTLLIVALGALVLIALGVLGLVLWPIVNEATSSGLGLKESAVIAFCVTLAVLVVLAIAAGDGLLGEIQYMIAAFGTFFVAIWLGIAWIF